MRNLKKNYIYLILFFGIVVSTFLALNVYSSYVLTMNTNHFKRVGGANAEINLLTSKENLEKDLEIVLNNIKKENIKAYINVESKKEIVKYIFPLTQKSITDLVKKDLAESDDFSITNKEFSFAANKSIKISSLKLYKESDIPKIFINFSSDTQKSSFVRMMNENFRNKYEIVETKDSFILNTALILFGNPFYIFVPIIFLILLVVIAEQKKEVKMIKTLKMYGVSNFNIFITYLKKYFPIFTSGIIVGAVVFLITRPLVLKISNYFLVLGLVFIIMILIFSSSYFFIRKNKITSLIKKVDLQHDNISIAYSIKIISLVFLISFISLKLLISGSIDTVNSKKWEISKGLNVIQINNKVLNEKLLNRNYDLYRFLNEHKAILASRFDNLRNSGDTQNIDNLIDGSTVLVNNNYLIANGIVDIEQKQVTIDENENKIFILIPEMYASKKDQIIDNLRVRYNASNISQEIVPIVIKNSQNFFSYNLNTELIRKNSNPIVRVVNNVNSIYLSDYAIHKKEVYIPSFENDHELVKNFIADKKLDNNYGALVVLHDEVLNNYTSLIYFNDMIYFNISIFGLIFLILTVYSTFIYMNLYYKESALKKIYGYNHFLINIKFYVITVIVYVIFEIAGYILNYFLTFPNAFNIYTNILLILFIIDLILSGMLLELYQINSLKKYTKGGIL